MDDWNDLKLVLAVVRSGSLTAAAKALGVAHSTAFRRLLALEERLGVRLFERLPAGVYAPTSAGERMAGAAERVETETAALGRDLLGADLRLSGRLRVTCSETLAFVLLTPIMAEFRREHPGITLDVVIDNRVLSLSRREADVALRVSRPREGDLHGRKLADIGWTLYATPDVLAACGPVDLDDLGRLPFVGWEEAVSGVNTADWLAAHVPERAFVYRTASVINQMVAARAGLGVALLPCYLGDAEPSLIRATPQPLPGLDRELWIVTHADLRRTARVRAFMDLVSARLAAARAQIAGVA
ncbi:LysR family transcriptional regulator [Phenylobacterium sp.]|jgi:DNA-binding transcriptional LysR family regulator|uniref:LysR family transcriptional regulator n=1 Tax=Phenylobacterium sp. TaxID=1871053 RepID=UPI002F959AAE